MQLSLIKAIKKLAVVWLSFSLFLILIMLLQTIFGKYGSQSVVAWLWLVPAIIPGNLLIVLGYLRHKKIPTALLPNLASLLFRIVFYTSVVYLIAVTLVLLLQPFGNSEKSEADKLHAADTGLIIFQALLLLAWGLFIYKTEQWLKENKNQSSILPEAENDVFISYNHNDKAVANLLKQKLEKENLRVLIDSDAMAAGQNIREFIQKCVLDSRVTLSVVSRASLLSGWVCMETVHTFYLEKFLPGKKFIACYLDDDFLSPEFTSTAVQQFDEQLQTIKALTDKHNILGIDTRDLNENKTRLLAIRNNLDEIIQRLKNSLCVKIKGEQLEENFPLIVKSIRE